MTGAKKPRPVPKVGLGYQFLIVLPDTEPLVWRRIQVPASYSFWDLHVAIQDAMGWKDYHLHEFTVRDPRTGRVKRIGIPDEDLPRERPCLAGWRVPIVRYLTYGSDPVRYLYDFGDGWKHTLDFEEFVQDGGGAYPRCVAGAAACPPEDVGGTHGYVRFLSVIRDVHHLEHDEMRLWAGEDFDPHAFNPASVRFDDPRLRWKLAFEDEGADA